jgi:hypothetical protein
VSGLLCFRINSVRRNMVCMILTICWIRALVDDNTHEHPQGAESNAATLLLQYSTSITSLLIVLLSKL